MKFNFEHNQVAVLSNFSDIEEILSVPLTVKTGVTKIYFGNYQRLQDTLLQRFEVIVNSNLTVAADLSTTLVSEATVDKCYLYLLDKNGNVKVDSIPLTKFKVNTTSTANNTYAVFPGFDNVDIDWQKSYIGIDSTTAAAENGKVIQVEISYMWKPGTAEFSTRFGQKANTWKKYSEVINGLKQKYGV